MEPVHLASDHEFHFLTQSTEMVCLQGFSPLCVLLKVIGKIVSSMYNKLKTENGTSIANSLFPANSLLFKILWFFSFQIIKIKTIISVCILS